MSRKALILFLALGVIWGVPYLLIRIAVADYHPVIVAFGRAAIGALVLLPFALRGKDFMAGFRKPGWLILFTLAEISGPWFLIGFAETRVTSSLAGLIIALTPIIAAILGVVLSQERPGAGRLIGLGLGLAGVVALLGFDERPVELWPVLALAASALGYAVGPIIVARKLADADDGAVVVASLIVASVIYLPFVPAYWPARFPLDASLAVIALAVVCTALAFQLLFALIVEVGASRATVIAYLNPAVAVLLGVVVLDEPFSLALLVGFALIVAGSYFATARKSVEARSDGIRAAAE
ncbi:DMT family transporter [Bosea sp. (in: a-proteobacteria)]|uniref:DMT family transporter n=1 Tax=Bosea sp. (in: a-proteobacteria) TaxID=1871050 RepID=UPI0025BAAE8E|nr:DMT family transporter [Bosea sp. (in: a-proteobacteria)]MBR3190421.1 DMT family transporter [Bosea sp. (in: a-proteobacteria)]